MKKIYIECPNCGQDISVELGEHDKQIKADIIEELFNKCVDTVDMDSNYLYVKVNRDNFNIPYIPLKSILKEWIIRQLKE